MKDPLASQLIPYEILGVEECSHKPEIDSAFKKLLGEGKSAIKLREAWNTLSRPVPRGMVDIFLYSDIFLRKIVPRADKNRASLIERRYAVAKAWQAAQKRLFPDFCSTHSLAVLWLHWALYAEREHLEEAAKRLFDKVAALASGPELSVLWHQVIANWTFIITSEEFWQEWKATRESTKSYLKETDLRELSHSVEVYLSGVFQSYIQKYREIGEVASVQRLQGYDLLYISELKTARYLNKVGVQIPKGDQKIGVSSGRLMLQEMNILASIRIQLERLAEAIPEDKKKKLEQLQASLSPFADIAVLVEHKKYQEAIHAIEGLPKEQKNEKDALSLLARAYLERGEQEFSLNQHKEALESWEKGLSVGELKNEIQRVIVSECKGRAASLQKNDPEAAIQILKMASKLVKDKVLTETLAEILATHGIKVINEAHNKLQAGEKGLTATIESTLKKGVRFLKEAKDLGSKRGAENYEKGKSLVEQVKSGMLGLDPAIAKLIQKAQQEASSRRWNMAITLMTQARNKLPSGSPARDTLTSQLAQLYNARGVESLNKATARMKTYQEMLKSDPESAKRFIDDLVASKGAPTENTRKEKKKQTPKILLILGGVLILLCILFREQLPKIIDRIKSLEKFPLGLQVLLIAVALIIFAGPLIIAKLKQFIESSNEKLKSYMRPPLIYSSRPGEYAYTCTCGAKADYKYGGSYICSDCLDIRRKFEEPQLMKGDDLEVKSARSDFEKAVSLDPKSSVFRKNLDQARVFCGRFNIN